MADERPRTAVVQPQRGIGDTLWHLPYLRAIARDSAYGSVLLVTKPSTGARELLRGEPSVGEVVYLRQTPRPPAYLNRLLELAGIYRRHGIRRLVILDKVSSPALAGRLAGVPERYGFGTRPAQLRWLTQERGIDPALHRAHPLEKLPAFAELMGWGAIDPEPALPVSPEAATAVAPLLEGREEPLYGIGIGASSPERIWPAPNTAALCAWLLEQGGTVLLFGGPGERPLAREIRQGIGRGEERVVDLCGRLDLDRAAAAMARCRLFFGMDSGPMNLAAAVGVTTFGIFATSVPLRHSRHLHPILTDDGRHGVADGIHRVSVEAVIRRLAPVLQQSGERLSAPG